MSARVDKVVKIYKTLAKNQILVGGRISNNGISINTQWTQRDLEKGKYVKFSKTHIINDKLEKIADSMPFDINTELMSAVCPSERYRAVLREIANGKEDKKQYLEIWTNNNLTNAVDLTALDVHGNLYVDTDFGSLEWSPDETKVIYIAEKKLPKREPFYKRKSEKSQNTSDGDSTPPSRGEEYTYRSEWGEQNVGKSQSIIAMYDINEDTVKILEGLPEHLCPGQVTWAPDSLQIIGIAWSTLPRKLGIVYCTNRPSHIFNLDLAGCYNQISEDGRSVQCPKFSPDGKYLLWMEGPVGGPHRGAMALVRIEYPVNNYSMVRPVAVVDIIQTETCTKDGQTFYGLYNLKFPRRCWAQDKRRLVFSTTQKTEIKSYVLNIETCELTELICEKGSLMIIDVINDKILASKKCYLHPDKVIIGALPAKGNERNIEWKVIQDAETTPGLENYMFQYLELSHNNNDSISTFNAIYFGPKCGNLHSVPLIVWPHGGPHSSYFNAYSLESSTFGSLGFAILFVNYRGSLGCGQKSVEFLLGRVGDTDVKDCVLATQECFKQFSWINPNNLLLNGGSHGGFLVHHLSGQYPDMFKAVVSRNPVIDIASMSLISDIPDWCSVEAGSFYNQKGPVDDELFLAMRKASPIQYAHEVKAPTFLMLGSKDLRVPAFQGIELFNRLKANNIPVKMNLYDDNHPLGAVLNEMDNIINGALWMLEHAA